MVGKVGMQRLLGMFFSCKKHQARCQVEVVFYPISFPNDILIEIIADTLDIIGLFQAALAVNFQDLASVSFLSLRAGVATCLRRTRAPCVWKVRDACATTF